GLALARALKEEAAAPLEPIVSLLAKLAALCNEAFTSASHSAPPMLGSPPPSQSREIGGPGSSTLAPHHEAEAWIAQALERETVSAIELEHGRAHAGASLAAAPRVARRHN